MKSEKGAWITAIAIALAVVLVVGAFATQPARAANKKKVLYRFKGGTDGKYPYGSLARDANGNLYGTTYFGGASGAGTVFRLSNTGKHKVLHSFTGEGRGISRCRCNYGHAGKPLRHHFAGRGIWGRHGVQDRHIRSRDCPLGLYWIV
jgi:uncharacterized repeat protein (TIGR03803 family)